jgi:hypothetical protein
LPTQANGGVDEARDSDAQRTDMTMVSRSDSFVTSESESSVAIDAGFVQPAVITSIVYVDGNQNGQYDDGELLIPGTTVILYDGNGNEVARAVTNAEGLYTFDALAPGVYEVEVVPPADYRREVDTRSVLGVQPGDTSTVATAVFAPTALDEVNEPGALNRHIYLPVLVR